SFVFTIKNGVIDSFILKPEKFGLYADEAKLNKPLSAEEQAEKQLKEKAGLEALERWKASFTRP
ncbi:transferase, partial [Bacillus paralicheniformis]|nr:transferase [Bacillus paralicheniformis]